MRGILIKDKKGVSILIGYILLVSMAISLSVIAFNWIQKIIPEETIVCPTDASLSIREVECNSSSRMLNFTIKNNGLFSIHNVSVFVNDAEGSDFGVFKINSSQFDPLLPGESFDSKTNYTPFVDGGGEAYSFQSNLRFLELRPYIVIEGTPTACKTVQTVLKCQ